MINLIYYIKNDSYRRVMIFKINMLWFINCFIVIFVYFSLHRLLIMPWWVLNKLILNYYQCEAVGRVADIIQIPAFLCRQVLPFKLHVFLRKKKEKEFRVSFAEGAWCFTMLVNTIRHSSVGVLHIMVFELFANDFIPPRLKFGLLHGYEQGNLTHNDLLTQIKACKVTYKFIRLRFIRIWSFVLKLARLWLKL